MIIIASQILLWLLLAAQSVVLLAMARQVGLLHERVAPVGALVTQQGPQAGQAAPRLVGHLLNGGRIEIGGTLAPAARRLLLFVAPSCPICKKLVPIALSFADREGLELVFVGDEDPEEQRSMVQRLRIVDRAFVNGPEIGMAFHVAKLPYAVLLDDHGTIVARGLVNSREHLESLTVVDETGVPDLQSFLRDRRTIPQAAE